MIWNLYRGQTIKTIKITNIKKEFKKQHNQIEYNTIFVISEYRKFIYNFF